MNLEVSEGFATPDPDNEEEKLVYSKAENHGWDPKKKVEAAKKGWYYPNPFVFLCDLAHANGWHDLPWKKDEHGIWTTPRADTSALSAAAYLDKLKEAGKKIRPPVDIYGEPIEW